MNLSDQLFEEEHIFLGSIDHDKDAEIETLWTHDVDYLRMLNVDFLRPVSAAQLKKRYDAIEKEQAESNNLLYFTIRLREAATLIGFARLDWLEWAHGSCFLQMGIGEKQNRRQGYGTQALSLLLRYIFSELNFHRVTANVPEYNLAAQSFFARQGFTPEVRRRQALHRDGRYWDLLQMGILAREWGLLHKDS